MVPYFHNSLLSSFYKNSFQYLILSFSHFLLAKSVSLGKSLQERKLSILFQIYQTWQKTTLKTDLPRRRMRKLRSCRRQKEPRAARSKLWSLKLPNLPLPAKFAPALEPRETKHLLTKAVPKTMDPPPQEVQPQHQQTALGCTRYHEILIGSIKEYLVHISIHKIGGYIQSFSIYATSLLQFYLGNILRPSNSK